MNCEEAESLIAESLAGELGEADRAALAAHLAGCATCRHTEAQWREDDLQLRDGFTPWRGAEATVVARTIRQLHREQRVAPAETKSSARAWLPFLVGLAAGFMLALALWRPWSEPTVARQPLPVTPPSTSDPTLDASVPQMTLASVIGEVEILPHESGEWTAAQAGAEISLGCEIRTQSDGLVEFTCPTGEKARLNTDSQMKVRRADEFQLVRGQIWAVGCADKELCVRTDAGAVLTKGGTVNVNQKAEETTVTATAGNASVRLVNREESLAPGEELTFSQDRVVHRDRAYSLALITAWMNPLMALKSPDDPELNAHVDALLSQLGASKMSLLSDAELRALGPSCTTPLARYIRSEDGEHDSERRRHAAKLLADLAPISLAGELIELLADQDGEVRAQAAAALKRITGLDMDCPPDVWRSDNNAAHPDALKRWRTWWQANSYRCQPPPPIQPPLNKTTA
jgi:hypothetical protein